MKKYQLSTALLNHILCVSTYDTFFNGYSEMEWAQEDFLNEHPDFEGEVHVELDSDANELAIIDSLGEVIDDYVKDYLREFGVQEITIGKWYRPMYYNFECDSVGLHFEVADDFLEKAARQIRAWKDDAGIRQYIADNFKSRDGFISFCPETLEELLRQIESGEPKIQAVGEFVTLVLWDKHDRICDSRFTPLLQEILEYNYMERVGEYCIAYVPEQETAAVLTA